MGGGVQHFLHSWVFPVGSLLLPVTPLHLNLLPDIQAKGAEGEAKSAHRNSASSCEGRAGVIAGGQSERTCDIPSREWVRDLGWVGS